MTQIVTEIPDDTRRRAATRALDAGYATVEEYVRALLLKELASSADAASGPADLEMDDELEQLLAGRSDNEQGSGEADAASFEGLRAYARHVRSGGAAE